MSSHICELDLSTCYLTGIQGTEDEAIRSVGELAAKGSSCGWRFEQRPRRRVRILADVAKRVLADRPTATRLTASGRCRARATIRGAKKLGELNLCQCSIEAATMHSLEVDRHERVDACTCCSTQSGSRCLSSRATPRSPITPTA